MKIKVVDNPPVDPREFDLPEGFNEGHIEDVVEIFNTPLLDITIGIILTQILASKNYMNLVKN